MRQHSTPHPGEAPVGYGLLVRENVAFRRLWIGNIISLLGDWFNAIALYSLVVQLTGSPLALGAVFIAKLLPWGLASPIAGVLVDRFNRRRLMIGSDIVRAVVVLGFLLVDTPGEVPLLFGLIALQVVAGAVFLPAQSASIPNITTARELLTANALMSATWSVMLAGGAALGGFVTAWLGEQAVFLIDSVTYLVSAYFLYRTVIPQHTDPGGGPVVRTAFREIVEGVRRLRRRPQVGRMALAKATWAAGGGALVYMLALLGEQVTTHALAAGIGVLFMARGIGTGIGPVVARAAFHDARRWPTLIGGCVIVSGLCYGGVGVVPWMPWAESAFSLLVLVMLVTVAHAASGANWVLSTVLLQQRTEDRYRGRVFATEWLVVMLTETLSTLAASLLLEGDVLTLRPAVQVFAAVQAAFGVLWLLVIVPRERRAVLAQD